MQKAEGEANLNVQDHLNGDNDVQWDKLPFSTLTPHTHMLCMWNQSVFYSDHDLETDTLDIVLDRR